MLRSRNKLIIRAIIEFLLLTTILGIAGYFIYYKMDLNLKNSLEGAVASQSRSIAFGLEQQFIEQFKKLKAATTVIENGDIDVDKLDEVFMVGTIDEKMGIVDKAGNVIAGDAFNNELLYEFQEVFRGIQSVKYRTGAGLIFAVPVKINDKICMLFNSHSDETIRKKFQATSYNGAGTIILLNGFQNWMILSEGEQLINLDPKMQEGWNQLINKFYSLEEDSVSIYYSLNNKSYFLYLAGISSAHHLAIVGYAPWKVVAVGIDYIYMVLIITFFIILISVMFAVRYMMKKREADELEHEKLIADSANKAKSEFLSNMSHEIRTPINAIMGMDEMILREATDSNIVEYAENLQNAARSLLSLVNDILDFSKIEAGKLEIIPVEYHLSSLLNDLVNMIQTRADKKNLTFEIEVSESIPSVLFGDEIRIKQIITNILTNAVKYTEKGGVKFIVEDVSKNSESIILKFKIQDTGIGIKKEDIHKLFSAFERIEEKRNRTIEGTGLGMNITQKLLTMMNSQLKVKSVYGQGSEFSFELEQKIINAEPIGNFQKNYRSNQRQQNKYQETFTSPDSKILVVDDTVMNLTVIKGLLKLTGIQIDTALNGSECISMSAKNKYDIIFLDHRMPGMDGIETLQVLKKMTNNPNENTPIISLTANAISGSREMYLSEGFNDYLTKPINTTQLEELLIKYLPEDKVKFSKANDESKEKIDFPEWLNNVENLEVNKGIEHCGGIESYIDALTVFTQSIDSSADLIENYYKANDFKNYTTKVHALKSSARVIGATELSELAKKLEDAGNREDIDEIKQHTDYLLKLYRSYKLKFESLLKKEDDDTDKPLITDYDLNEAYEVIKDSVATFDYDSLQFVFDSLNDYRLPEEEKERIKRIKQSAEKLEWEEIKKILEEV